MHIEEWAIRLHVLPRTPQALECLAVGVLVGVWGFLLPWAVLWHHFGYLVLIWVIMLCYGIVWCVMLSDDEEYDRNPWWHL